MSRADERRAALERHEREQDAQARPVEIVHDRTKVDPDSWYSVCAGTRDGDHYKLRVEPDGRWRCQHCYRLLNAPTPEERSKVAVQDRAPRWRPSGSSRRW